MGNCVAAVVGDGASTQKEQKASHGQLSSAQQQQQQQQQQGNALFPPTKRKLHHSGSGGGLQGADTLLDTLERATKLLQSRETEEDLTNDEIQRALSVYTELKRVLSKARRTPDWMGRPTSFECPLTDFRDRFTELMREFDDADASVNKALSSPAAVQPLSSTAINERCSSDFLILDNSLRETTVGASRGHTLEEKHQIVKAMAETGLEEVILGAFGSKVSVDSQIAEQWRRLGKSFDSTWGFSDCYDYHPLGDEAEEKLWKSVPQWVEAEEKGEKEIPFFTPPFDPRVDYDKSDMRLFAKASAGFCDNPFGKRSLKRVLKDSSSEDGRIPMGLLMLAGYGIKNAIIEVATSVETFEYEKHDIIERVKFLIRWCKENLPRRDNVSDGEDDRPRVLINLTDFSNYNRSKGGLEQALHLVDAMCRLPPEERPMGFMMEEPTGWLFPDEVGKLCRMVRLTMERAGFPEGRFLVHVHWYFGLAEAVALSCLCNGADGVWAAVCKTGAQTGHACSTMTVINLFRAGHHDLARKYNFEAMCKAAREVHAISTRQPCPSHEEIYGEQAFDMPYFMLSLPSCRYSIAMVLKEMGIINRTIRLNEIVAPSAVHVAMSNHFGPPEEGGWDPRVCKPMFEAIKNHLLTGLSRDYNTALGLGHLYGLVSRQHLPTAMIKIMMQNSRITDYHPTVLEFILRWNRLCAKYEGEEQPHPATRSNSILMHGTDTTVEPRRLSLPFDYFTADVMRNPTLDPIPRLFKMQVVSLLTQDERRIQKRRVPQVEFYEMVLRLKLFIEEADSLGVLGLVEDFCIRKNHDFFFGEDNLWLAHVRGSRPKHVKKMLRAHMDFYPKFYAHHGNTAIMRCVKAAAKRIDANKGIRQSMYDELRRGSGALAVRTVAMMHDAGDLDLNDEMPPEIITEEHLKMLQELAEDEGEDPVLSADYVGFNNERLGMTDSLNRSDLGAAYVNEVYESATSEVSARRSSARPYIRGSITVLGTVQEFLVDEEDGDDSSSDGQEEGLHAGMKRDNKQTIELTKEAFVGGQWVEV